MNHLLIKFPFLKISLFIFLVILPIPLSTVVADDNPSRQVDHNMGKGLSNHIQLTEKEQAWLNQKNTVRVRINDFPPHMMTLPEPRGISVDYLKLIGKRFGINFKFVVASNIPWKEAVEDLESNRTWFDLLPTIKRTPEREKKISFTQDYLFAPWVIVNRTNAPYVSRMDDLNGRSIAVERGYVIEGLIKDKYPQIKLVVRFINIFTNDAVFAMIAPNHMRRRSWHEKHYGLHWHSLTKTENYLLNFQAL